jgi:hypothetical protein
MAKFDLFSTSENEESEPFQFSNIFGNSDSVETLEPKGEPTFGDYFKDVVWTGPAKGLGNAVRGLLSIPAFVVDFGFDTDTLTKLDNLFNDGFLKIPETKTTLGDITSVLVQYGIPIARANKLASFIPGLSSLSGVSKLEPTASLVTKGLEYAKRAGYFGAVGGITDFAVSAPGVNKTAGEQFGLLDGYAGENLSGRDKAVEVIKDKLRFAAEGATLGGAIPLLPVAGTLGFKYGLQPAGQALGYVGNKTIRAINYTVRNPVASVLSGGEIANVTIPAVIPKLVSKVQSGMGTVGEKILSLVPAKETALGKMLYGANKKFDEWFLVNENVTAPGLFEAKNTLKGEVNLALKKATDNLENMDKILKEKILGNQWKALESGKSMPVVQYNQSILQDYFNTPGNVQLIKRMTRTVDPKTGEKIIEVAKDKNGKIIYDYKYFENEATKDILAALDKKVVGSEVAEYAKNIKQSFVDLKSEIIKKLPVTEAELKNGFMEFMDTSFKQGLAAFKNNKFAVDPAKQERLLNLFKNDVLLSATELRETVRKRQLSELFKDDPIARAVKKAKRDISELLYIDEKNLPRFNTQTGLNLDIRTVNNIKSKIKTNLIDDTVFSKIKDKKDFVNLTSKNLDEFNKKYKVKLTGNQVDDFKKYLNLEAETRVRNIRDVTLKQNLDTQSIFKSISDQLGELGVVKFKPYSVKDIKPGETIPEITTSIDSLAKLNLKIGQLSGKRDLKAIVDYLSTPKGATVKINGKNVPLPESTYNYGVLDTILYLSNQRYQGKFYKSLLDMSDKQTEVSKKLILTKEEAEQLGRDQFTNIQKGVLDPNDYKSLLDLELIDGTYFARPEIVNAIKEQGPVFGLMNNPIYKSFMKFKSLSQTGGTVFSPTSQARNVTGNFMSLFGMNVLGSKISLGDSWKIAYQDLFRSGKLDNVKFEKMIDSAVERGVIRNNLQINEIKKSLNIANEGKLDLDSFADNKIVKNFFKAYQLSDDAPKLFADRSFQSIFGTAFKAENPVALKQGTKAYDDFVKEVKDFHKTVFKKDFIDMNYATGELKTATEMLEEMSGNMVKNLMPTYSMIPKIVRMTQELPIGNFVSFPAEILRNSSKLVLFGARALTSSNPLIRQMGAHFLIGASGVFGGIGYVASKGAEALTGVTEEKMDAFKRSFAAQYQKNSTLIPTTSVDANGNFKYYNFSYTNPYDTVVRPANAVLGAFADGSLNKDSVDKIVMNSLFGNTVTGRSGAFGELFAPFISESVGTERFFDVFLRDGVKKGGGKIFYPTDDTTTKITRGLEHVIGGIVPGGARSAQRIWEGATGKFTDAGTVRDMGAEFTALTTGIRIEDAKPLASMPFIVTSYNKDKQNIDRKFAETVYRPSSSPEKRLAAYKTYLLQSYDSQNRMYQTLKDGVTLGIDEADLKDIVGSRLNNKSETNLLFDGTYKVPTYNKKAFDSMISRLERENPILAGKVADQIDVVKEIFNDLNSEFRGFDLGSPKETFENLLNKTLTPGVREIRRQPQSINLLPSSSRPVTPGTTFTNNTPPVAANVLTSSQQGQPGQQFVASSLGQRYNLLPTSAERSEFLDKVVSV